MKYMERKREEEKTSSLFYSLATFRKDHGYIRPIFPIIEPLDTGAGRYDRIILISL